MALASVGRRRRRSGTRPGPPKAQLRCWDEVILRGHPQREQFVSYLRDGVGLYDMWLPPFRGPLVDQPFDPDRFRGATVFPNRMPSAFSDFVENEIDSLPPWGCSPNKVVPLPTLLVSPRTVPAPVTSEPALRAYMRSSVCINAALSFDIITSVQVGKLSVRHPGSVSAKNTLMR